MLYFLHINYNIISALLNVLNGITPFCTDAEGLLLWNVLCNGNVILGLHNVDWHLLIRLLYSREVTTTAYTLCRPRTTLPLHNTLRNNYFV